MKHCPQCNLDYFDNTLEFCLEDGAKLFLVSNQKPSTIQNNETPTVTKSNSPNSATEKTLHLPFPTAVQNINTEETNRAANFQTVPPQETIASNALVRETDLNYKILEIAPIVLALSHNWWQWLYLNNQYYSSLATYVLSANFLMWVLLLIAGATVSLLALRHSRNRIFIYTSLIILSINLLLFLVPKR